MALIIHDIMAALEQAYPRAVHYSELANAANLEPISVSNALNHRLEAGGDDLKRVRRGVWEFVPKEPKPVAKKVGKPLPRATPEVTEETLPASLKVMGTMQGGIMAKDTRNGQLYKATRL